MESALISFRTKSNMRQADLAKELRISPSVLCKWEKRRIPAERVLEVERLTGIPRWQLRPDLYPPTDVRVSA